MQPPLGTVPRCRPSSASGMRADSSVGDPGHDFNGESLPWIRAGSGLDPELSPGVGLVYNGREVGTCFPEPAPDRSHTWSLVQPGQSLVCRPGSPRATQVAVLSSSDWEVVGRPAEPLSPRVILKAMERDLPGQRSKGPLERSLLIHPPASVVPSSAILLFL